MTVVELPGVLDVAVHWSGGKDAALALSRLLRDDRYVVRCLITTVHGTTPVSSVHRLSQHLLQAQADAIGVPLHTVELSGPGLDDYVPLMAATARRLRAAGIDAVAFGDLDHSGAFAYRCELFEPAGLEVLEPLAGLSARECIEAFLCSGISAITVVVDADQLDADRLGVLVDRAFVDSLPDGCDPCGELGEYHSFVFDAPFFAAPVAFTITSRQHIERDIGTSDGPRAFRYWQLHVG